jgi:hypothetical protein
MRILTIAEIGSGSPGSPLGRGDRNGVATAHRHLARARGEATALLPWRTDPAGMDRRSVGCRPRGAGPHQELPVRIQAGPRLGRLARPGGRRVGGVEPRVPRGGGAQADRPILRRGARYYGREHEAVPAAIARLKPVDIALWKALHGMHAHYFGGRSTARSGWMTTTCVSRSPASSAP